MINHSAEYDRAVVADSRKQYVRAVFDLVDPDLVVTGEDSNTESDYSKAEQISIRSTEETNEKIATLELNRWTLTGDYRVTDEAMTGHIGWESCVTSDGNGSFIEPFPYVEFSVAGVSFVQAVTVVFSGHDYNGRAEDFYISIWSGETLAQTVSVEENKNTVVVVSGFSVDNPTRVRLTIKKWNGIYRRARVPHLFAGFYEEWDVRTIQSADVYTEVTFSGLSMPSSSCTLEIYNENHRFDPYSPNSILQSIEERQAIPVSFGMLLEDGSIEWIPGGTYYQQSGGWSTHELTVRWKLLDIIGMLVKRKFAVPSTMPTTLAEWVNGIVASVGTNFIGKTIIDIDVANIPLTADVEKVRNAYCGDLLRYACMATNTWPRQDFASGYLRVGKLEHIEGNAITLDNMSRYPVMSANDDVASITFALDEGGLITFQGTNPKSEVSLRVNNPFIHTVEDAHIAIKSCLMEYGGKHLIVQHRGNPSSSVGDIQAVDTQFDEAVPARLYKQQLKFDNGAMINVPSYLVQIPSDLVNS